MTIFLQTKDEQALEFIEAFLQLFSGTPFLEFVGDLLGSVYQRHCLADR